MAIGMKRSAFGQNSTSHNRAEGLKVLVCAVALVLGATAVHAQWLEKVIYLPDSLSGVLWPSCIAGNPEFHKVYVSGEYDGTFRGGFDAYVIVLDSRTGEKQARVPVQFGVSSLAYNPVTSKLYAARNGYTVVIDGESDQVISVFACDPNRARLCCNTVNGKVYRTSETVESLSVIEGAGDSVMAKVYVPGSVWSLTFDSLLNKLYCGYSAPGQSGLLVIDGEADTVVADIPVPFTVFYAVVSRQHRRLYCAGVVDNNPTLVIVDTDRDTIVGTMPGGGALCINDLRDELYFSGPGDTILALDCSGDTIARRLAAFPGREIVAVLGCLPERDRMICRLDNWVYLLDLATGDILPGPHPNWTFGATYPLPPIEGRLHGFVKNDDAVTVLEVQADSLVQTEISVGSQPSTLCVAARANKVYAGDYARGSVYSLDCSSGRVKALRLPGPFVPALCYDSLDNKIYVSTSAESVYAIDCATDSVVAAIPTGESPHALCYNPLRNRIYSANSDSRSLTVIDCFTDSAIASVRLGFTTGDYALLYNSQRDELLCARHEYPIHEIEVVDCATSRVVDTLPYTFFSIVYHRALGKLHLININPPVVVLDAASDSLVATIPGVSGEDGGLNETDSKVYAIWGWGSLVVVVDAKADTVTSRITSIPTPQPPAHDVLNDKVYIASGVEPGKVFVLDGPTDAILDSIPVLGMRPRCAIWNPVDGRVYVANAYSGSISVVRDTVVPGIQDAVAVLREHGGETVTRQLNLPAGLRQADIYDVSGRRVARLGPRSDSVGRLGVGVYFVAEPGRGRATKVVVLR